MYGDKVNTTKTIITIVQSNTCRTSKEINVLKTEDLKSTNHLFHALCRHRQFLFTSMIYQLNIYINQTHITVGLKINLFSYAK